MGQIRIEFEENAVLVWELGGDGEPETCLNVVEFDPERIDKWDVLFQVETEMANLGYDVVELPTAV